VYHACSAWLLEKIGKRLYTLVKLEPKGVHPGTSTMQHCATKESCFFAGAGALGWLYLASPLVLHMELYIYNKFYKMFALFSTSDVDEYNNNVAFIPMIKIK
jgi:hypothetical protein